MIIKDIKKTKSLIDLDMALTLMNSVQGDFYILAKYHLEDMKNVTLAHTKECLKLMEQKTKDD